MGLIHRLIRSKAALNASASYLSFASASIGGLITIPIAVSYLSKAQMGLWSIVFTIVTYLLWLDLGIGNATGRKIASAILEKNQIEINRWWTLSMGVLLIMGIMVFLVALGISPFLRYLLDIPSDLAADAIWLFLGMAAVSAIGMPVRAYPGLLIAQEQFHWVPLVQALLPWLQLGPFWYLLHQGFGIRSYLPAIAFAQLCGWTIFVWKVHSKDLHVCVDFGGWTKTRFRNLLAYSSSLAVTGIVDSVVQSLPSLLLARLGGLPNVAVYNLSNRAPVMAASMVQRTTHSFYPNLQKLFVSEEYDRFLDKYRRVNQAGIWVSLAGAGVILAGNRPFVCWLAKADFYSGSWTNVWLACSIITFPFVSNLLELFQIAGKMGKTALFSLIELPVGIVLCMLGFKLAGLPGLTASFALLPLLIRGPYALLVGPHYCGCEVRKLCGGSLVALSSSLLLIITGGSISAAGTVTPQAIDLLGRSTFLPTWTELVCGSLAAAIGAVQALRLILQLKAH